jgi:D-3-phosphoglycerate dehydrogenase
MKNILTLNAISPVVNDIFDATYKVENDVENPVGIMLRSFKMHDYELNANTIAIARAGAGTNNIPVEKYAEQGVVVFNTPGANANAVKELVLAALLMGSRNVINATDWVKTLKGQGAEVEAGSAITEQVQEAFEAEQAAQAVPEFETEEVAE